VCVCVLKRAFFCSVCGKIIQYFTPLFPLSVTVCRHHFWSTTS
jgi:hypothetical protein